MKKLILPLLMLATLGAVDSGLAETIKVPVGEQSQDTPFTVPKTGMTKAQVEKQFGEALEKTAPVGNPPISQWKYAEYTVYFEYDHVIHSVRTFHRQDMPTQ